MQMYLITFLTFLSISLAWYGHLLFIVTFVFKVSFAIHVPYDILNQSSSKCSTSYSVLIALHWPVFAWICSFVVDFELTCGDKDGILVDDESAVSVFDISIDCM